MSVASQCRWQSTNLDFLKLVKKRKLVWPALFQNPEEKVVSHVSASLGPKPYRSFATDVIAAMLDDHYQTNFHELYCSCHPTWPPRSLSFESLGNGCKPPISKVETEAKDKVAINEGEFN